MPVLPPAQFERRADSLLGRGSDAVFTLLRGPGTYTNDIYPEGGDHECLTEAKYLSRGKATRSQVV